MNKDNLKEEIEEEDYPINCPQHINVEGWTLKKMKKTRELFYRLSYKEVRSLLSVFKMGFGEFDFKTEEDKENIMNIIVDDIPYDQIIKETKKIIEKELADLNSKQ